MCTPSELVSSRESQRIQLAVAAESRLTSQQAWFRELGAVPELLEPAEAVLDVFMSYWGRVSMSAGLLLETSDRLLFVSFGFFRRRPAVRSVGFDEIDGVVADPVLRTPRLILTLRNGRTVRLEATRLDRESFADLTSLLQRRIGGRFDPVASGPGPQQ
jgi:hypothetical protein